MTRLECTADSLEVPFRRQNGAHTALRTRRWTQAPVDHERISRADTSGFHSSGPLHVGCAVQLLFVWSVYFSRVPMLELADGFQTSLSDPGRRSRVRGFSTMQSRQSHRLHTAQWASASNLRLEETDSKSTLSPVRLQGCFQCHEDVQFR
jgi:hypothetical protein